MNNQFQKYLVLLRPLAPFFFGSEQGQTADYYLKGNNFPQQTTLLGLIRHQLLIQNGLLPNSKISDTSKAASLIGNESFQYNKTRQDFGAIEEISECLICYTDKKQEKEEVSVNHYRVAPPSYANSLAFKDGHYVFTEYNPKNHYVQNFNLLSHSKSCSPSITDYDIFATNERPGIDKNYNGQPNEDAYYKQVWMSMNTGYSFGFYVTIKNPFQEDEFVKLENALVNFGKESAPFFMTVSVADTSVDSQAKANKEQNALYLTSDAYSTEDLSAFCRASVTDTIPFRNLINYVSQPSEAYFNRKPGQTIGSSRLQLYKKGSFFYSEEIQVVADKIRQHLNFVKTGYNRYQFTTINIKS